jgi:phage internal scaffolding protein
MSKNKEPEVSEPRHIRDIFAEMARVQVDFSESPSCTKSEFKEEADINNIVAQCIKKAMSLPSGNRQPMFEDFSEVGTYQDAVTAVAQTNEEFSHLPSDIRARFDNNPQSLLDFLGDSENKEEAIELGLLPSDKEESTNLVEPELETTSSEENIQTSNSES